MRTSAGMAAAVLTMALLGACGDDGGGGAGGLASLGDDPSTEDCMGAVRAVFDAIEIPDGYDPSDGVDDDELAAAEAEIERVAGELGFDPRDTDHPCDATLDELPEDEAAAFIDSIDPEKIAFLASLAQPRFEPIEDEL